MPPDKKKESSAFQSRGARRILLFAACALVLGIALVWADDVGIVSLNPLQRASAPMDVQATLQYLDVDSVRIILEGYMIWERLLELGEDQESLEILRRHALNNGMKGIYANFALFRLRDDPELRLRSVLERLIRGDQYEQLAIRILLDQYLYYDEDYMYAPLLREYEGLGDDYARQTLRLALAHFPDEGQAIDALLLETRSDDSFTRAAAAFQLGELPSKNPGYRQNPEVIEGLIELLHDGDQVVRGIASISLAKHGANDDSFAALLVVFRTHRDEWTRVAALDAIAEIGANDEVIPILREALDDPSEEVRKEAAKWIARFESED